MEKIVPEFKDVDELNTIMIIAILTVLFWIWTPIIAYLALKETLSPAANNVTEYVPGVSYIMVGFTSVDVDGVPPANDQ